MDTELIISNVQGFPPVSRLYRVGEEYFVITALDMPAIVERFVRGGLGDPKVIAPGPVDVFRVAVASEDVFQWGYKDGVTDPSGPDDYEQKFVETRYAITPLSQTGDAADYLEAVYTLDPGTSFDAALTYILEHQ